MLRILIAAPLLLLMVVFALSNPKPETFALWPTDYTVQLPLSLAVLGAMGVAFLFGALVLWVSLLGARARARRAERHVRMLEAQVSELKLRLAQAQGSVMRPVAPQFAPGTAASPALALSSR